MDAAVFYDATVSQPQSAAAGCGKLRCNLTLNLQESRPPPRNPLTSPDLHPLKLSSPELERLIIQSCSGLTPTAAAPIPARLFPQKHVTDEQEGFADGFVRALAELHSQQQMPCVPGADGHPGLAPPTCAGFGERAQDAQQVWDGYADAPIGPHVPPNFQCAAPLKEEPQRVPETPPLSPIDMEDQERIKAERKRMRNRVAASKCRKRKLERLARLEERVGRLSGENGELRTVAQALRDQVLHLRHELLEHIKSGCKQLSQQLQSVKDF